MKDKSRSARARKQLGIPEPVLEFDIFHYFQVKIFETRGKMRRYLKYINPHKKCDTTYARIDEANNEIILCLWTCTDNCVSHEMFHAAMLRASRTGLQARNVMAWGHPVHELVAEDHGNLVSEFWRKFTKAGFERKECWGFSDGK